MLEQPSFGRRIKALRLERGLSQAALVGEGMSAGYLSRLESGERPPTAHAVQYLADRFGVPVSDLDKPMTGSLSQALAVATSANSDDAIEALKDAFAADHSASHEQRWQALWMLAQLKNRLSQHAAEYELLTELNELADAIGVAEFKVRTRTQLARCMRSLGKIDDALAMADSAVTIARGNELCAQDTVPAVLALATIQAEAGRLQEAAATADEACDRIRGTNGSLLVEALWTAAAIRVRQGNGEAAEHLLTQALEVSDSRQDLRLWMRLRLAAASQYLQLIPPQVDAARMRLAEAEPALHLVGVETQQQELLTLQAHLAFHEGRIADARAICDQLDTQDLHLSFRDRTRLGVLKGQLLILEGNVDAGLNDLRELAQEARASLNIDLAAEIWRVSAETLANARPGNANQ